MKYLNIFLFLIFFSNNLYSKDNYVSDIFPVVTQKVLKSYDKDNLTNIMKIDCVYWGLYRRLVSENNDIYFKIINLEDSTEKKFLINKEAFDKTKYLKYIDYGICDNKLLCISTQESIHIFDFINGKELKIFYHPKSDYFATSSEYDDKSFIFYNADKGSGRYITSLPSNTFIKLINKNDFSEEFYNFPDPKGIKWSSIRPRKLMDYHNDKVVVANADSYNIRLYNKDSLITIIHKKNNQWNYDTTSYQPENKADLYRMMDDMKSINLIQKVDFLDDNHILVSWTSPDTTDRYLYNMHFDIWQIDLTTGKYNILVEDIVYKNRNDDDLFFINESRMDYDYDIIDGKLVYIVPYPEIYPEGKFTREEVENKIYENIFQGNDLKFMLIERDIKF